ncbi:bactofilin family protein [Acetivibrio clariflavus]|uniref:bactofilin family protein n=1 Tax=Acetivibrio clariflavus TaxID=288965 RepID=UPI000485A8BD|nr:polymer-forming cytoskeletal protein [Acetivibrio clariflavus]
MFSKNTSGNADSFDTIIGINSKFDGNIESSGTIRIDGKVNGDIKVKGDVYVGKEAVITGNINANNIFVSGRVEGNVEANGILKIQSSAKLYGDISVNCLVTEEGSVFEGKCKMLTKSQAENASGANNSKKSKNNASASE